MPKLFRSGYGKLRELEADPDIEGKMSIGDYLREVIDHSQIVKVSGIERDVSRIGPVLDELKKLSKARATMRAPVAGRAGVGVRQIRAALDRKSS